MPDDTSIDIVDGLKGQHVQLRRLLAQQSWIASAPRNTLSEIDTQLTQIKSMIAELERVVAAQLVALKDQETIAQMSDRTKLYRSPNGDTWYLARDRASDQGFVIHEPNVPSGGRPSRIEIADFLRSNDKGPEHQALLRLIGRVVKAPF